MTELRCARRSVDSTEARNLLHGYFDANSSIGKRRPIAPLRSSRPCIAKASPVVAEGFLLARARAGIDPLAVGAGPLLDDAPRLRDAGSVLVVAPRMVDETPGATRVSSVVIGGLAALLGSRILARGVAAPLPPNWWRDNEGVHAMIDWRAWVVAGVVAGGTLAGPCLAQQPDVKTLATGAAAPDFALPGVDGRIHRLKDFADAKILVENGAGLETWLDRLLRDAASPDLRVVVSNKLPTVSSIWQPQSSVVATPSVASSRERRTAR